MKKIYSIIAVASMMLTSVFGFTSCQKDEMPSPQKIQTVQTQQPAVTVTTSSTSSAGTSCQTMTTDGSSLTYKERATNAHKIDDTNYVVGTWTATVNGTAYTLVVTSNSAKGKSDVAYKATFYAGDQAFEGEYSAALFYYTGSFESAEKTADGELKAWLSCATFAESNLNEFTADLTISGKSVAEDVKFVKK